MFINNNVRFCYQSKEKSLSWNTFGRMQIWIRKDKIENLIDDGLDQSSSDESDSECDNDKDNAQSFDINKNLIVCVNHALLGFYVRQYV